MNVKNRFKHAETVRTKAVDAYKNGNATMQEVANTYGVSRQTIIDWLKRDAREEDPTNIGYETWRRRPRIFTGEEERQLIAFVQENPLVTLEEIRSKFQKTCELDQIRRDLKRLCIFSKEEELELIALVQDNPRISLKAIKERFKKTCSLTHIHDTLERLGFNRKSQTGFRIRIFSPEDERQLVALILEEPEISLKDIKVRFHKKCSLACIHATLERLGLKNRNKSVGRPRIFSPEEELELIALVQEKPSVSLLDIKVKFNKNCSLPCIHNVLTRLGLRKK